MSRIQLGLSAREKYAEHCIDTWCAAQPAPPSEPVVDAPAVSNTGQPSFYGPGMAPVVSTAGKPKGQQTVSEMRIVAWTSLASYGLVRAKAPRAMRDEAHATITRARGGPWRFWRLSRRRRTQDFTDQIHVHVTRPVVLTNLEPRPIVCDSYAQAQAECERVGKTILR